MGESTYVRPLGPLLIGFIFGIFWGDLQPEHTPWAWTAATVGFLAAAVGAVISRRPVFSPFFLFVALGYIAVQPWTAPDFPNHHIHRFADQDVRCLSGTVIDDPQQAGKRIRFTLMADAVGKDAAPVSGNVRVTLWQADAIVRIGDRLLLSGKIRPIRSFKNPGGFDYERFMARQGVFVSMHAQSHAWERIGRRPLRFHDRWRLRIRDSLAASADGASAAILKALIIGDRSNIAPELRDRFSRAGIAHLLAISGLHIGIVALVAFAALRFLLSRIDRLLWNGWLLRATAMGCLVPVLGYGMISGFSPATQRALVMTGVVLAACVADRRPDPVNLLILAAMAILIWHPPLLFSISFQLSFAAVATIMGGMGAIQERLQTSLTGWSRRLAGFIAVTGFAVLGTLPLVMRYFNQISITGLVANLLFVPLIGFAAVPVGLTGAFFAPVWHSGASACFFLSDGLVRFALFLLPAFSELGVGSIRTFTPTWIEIVGYYGLNASLLTLYRLHNDETHVSRIKKGVFILLGGLLLAGGVNAVYWHQRRFAHSDLRLTVMDVGHGSATLVEFPGGETMLIDGGGFYDNAIFDVGERIVAPVLWHHRILTLDSVVLTHADSDHLNGLLFVLRHFNVGAVLHNGVPKDTEGYREFRRIIQERGIPLKVPEPHTRKIGDVAVTLLHPSPEFRSRYAASEEQNDLSLVYRIQRGDQSVLIASDIEAFAESVLASRYGGELKSTVLIAPHHGCKTSSTESFLDRVKPKSVVISASGHARFRCPHDLVLNRYAKRNTIIFRTDRVGAVVIEIDARNRMRVLGGIASEVFSAGG